MNFYKFTLAREAYETYKRELAIQKAQESILR
jgi:hypothetical protein